MKGGHKFKHLIHKEIFDPDYQLSLGTDKIYASVVLGVGAL